MAKELFFSVIVRTENIYGTGGVIFSANKFKGFIANDYLLLQYPHKDQILKDHFLHYMNLPNNHWQ